MSALSLAIVSPASAGHHHGGGKTLTCRGPGSLSGYFELAGKRKVTAKRTNCAKAKQVVKKFPKTCFRAYSAQGTCKVHAAGRWRCRSRMIRGADQGLLPGRERCRRRRSRVSFVVNYLPASEPHGIAPVKPRGSFKQPYDQGNNCIDLKPAGTVIPPPNPRALGNFEIHVLRGPVSVGEDLQAALVAHQVSPILYGGLGSQPRSNPDPIPIFVTDRRFDSANDLGVTVPTCPYPNEDAAVVRTNLGPNDPPLGAIAAHELFHAYAFWSSTGGHVAVPWWEEASATWSQSKTGFPEDARWNPWLQEPNHAALDYVPPERTSPDQTWQYGMWRFVQWLDDRGLIGGDPVWPLERQVISGYGSAGGATFALFQGIPKQNSGTSLGVELAAFWGDRLKAKPLHGPQLVPVEANANQVEIDPGVTEVPTTAERLHTKLFDFTLAKKVQRVELEFDPPDDGYYWGLVKPNESQRFRKDDSVTFCVGGGDPDTLEWPGHFPVTFTNGSLSAGSIQGKITIRASKDAGQCQLPTPDNRACQLLRDARVNELLGAGTFPYYNQDQDSESKTWICFYTAKMDEVDLNLLRALKLTQKQVRENAKKQIESLGLRRLKDVGDIAGIGTDTANGKTYNIVVFAVAKEVALFTLSRADDEKAITLAKRLAGQLD